MVKAQLLTTGRSNLEPGVFVGLFVHLFSTFKDFLGKSSVLVSVSIAAKRHRDQVNS